MLLTRLAQAHNQHCPPQDDSCDSIQETLVTLVEAVENATKRVVEQRKLHCITLLENDRDGVLLNWVGIIR